MNYKLIQYLLCVLICATLAQAKGPHGQTANQGAASQESKLEICKLLTSDEIKSVQGDTVEQATPSTPPSSGLRMSQCLYRTSFPVRSVSIALATPAAQQPREYWRKQFHRGGEKEEEDRPAANKKNSSREQEEAESKPRTIKGVGDEAYWVGGPITGALYVLHGNMFFRISVGGVRDEAARIEKSVALARAALKRL